jgi:O-antigen ligase
MMPQVVTSRIDASTERRRRKRSVHARILWYTIAFGAVLFGAVYPWVYAPLLAAVAAIGVYGWMSSSEADRAAVKPVIQALLIVIGIIVLQLVPLPLSLLTRVSPATDSAVRQYDLTYAIARATTPSAWHATSIWPPATARGLAFAAALTIFLAGTAAMMPRVPITWLVRRIAAFGLVMALFGIVQRGTSNGRLYWVWLPVNKGGVGNAFGPFVNRNHFAGWMVMALALTAGYVCALLVRTAPRRHLTWREWIGALSSNDSNRIAFCTCALAVMALSIVWTMSRSGIVALAVVASVLSALALLRVRGGRGVAFSGFLLAIVVLGVAWKGVDTVAEWYGRTSTLEWRVQLWRDTGQIVRDFPWLGTGFNTFGISTLLYPMTDQAWHASEAHSDYVQIVSEGGIVLAAAVLWTLIQFIRLIRAAFAQPQSPSLYWIRAGATIGLIALAVQELVEFSLQIPADAVLFAVLAAVAVHRPSRHDQPI